jgi:hypothetical protein
MGLPAKEVSMTPNIADIIRHHVSLEVRCIDRIYLHAYMPKLQTSGGLCYFLHDYLGHPVPSPALLKPRHDRLVAAVEQFAHERRFPSSRSNVATAKTSSWRPTARGLPPAKASS